MMISKKTPVYLDVCALGRPYDDQSYMRIRIESTAVQLIITHVKVGRFRLYYSPVHVREIGDNPDEIVRTDLIALLHEVGEHVKPQIEPHALRERGRALIAAGVGAADAFHIAHAEQVCSSFVTCDDRLLRKCRSLDVGVWYGTPVAFCKKEGLV
jgi:predicted nucleic acid-binding protein